MLRSASMVVALALGGWLATASPVSAENAQQEKMKSCNAEASTKSLKGDARKAFMESCLSAGGGLTPQQEKMKTCNHDATAKDLKGDARKSFMKSCLSGS